MAGQKKQAVHDFSRLNTVLNNTGSSATPHPCAPYIPLLITYCCTLHTAANYILLHTICHCTLHTTAHYCALHTLHTPAHYILATAHCIHTLRTIYYSTLHILLQTAGVRGLVVTGGETEPRPGPTKERTVDSGVGAGAPIGAPTNRATSAAAATAAALVGGTSLVGHLLRTALGGKISCGINGKVS